MRGNDGSNYEYPEQRWFRMLVSYKLNPTKGLTILTYFSTFRFFMQDYLGKPSFPENKTFPIKVNPTPPLLKLGNS